MLEKDEYYKVFGDLKTGSTVIMVPNGLVIKTWWHFYAKWKLSACLCSRFPRLHFASLNMKTGLLSFVLFRLFLVSKAPSGFIRLLPVFFMVASLTLRWSYDVWIFHGIYCTHHGRENRVFPGWYKDLNWNLYEPDGEQEPIESWWLQTITCSKKTQISIVQIRVCVALNVRFLVHIRANLTGKTR